VNPAPWRSAAALVFVEDVASPELSAEDAHHLSRVLRLRPGSELCLSDGVGSVRSAELGDRGTLAGLGDVQGAPPTTDGVTVGVVPPKGERLEWLVGRLCELGVDRISLLESERSVVRWDEARWGRAEERLRRVVRSASAQSRRPRWPELERADLRSRLAAGVPVADLDGRPPDAGDRELLVGPEGGWSEAERALADAGGGRVQLAADVLRVETAAVAAASALALARLGALRG